jgi:hypothetical protein
MLFKAYSVSFFLSLICDGLAALDEESSPCDRSNGILHRSFCEGWATFRVSVFQLLLQYFSASTSVHSFGTSVHQLLKVGQRKVSVKTRVGQKNILESVPSSPLRRTPCRAAQRSLQLGRRTDRANVDSGPNHLRPSLPFRQKDLALVLLQQLARILGPNADVCATRVRPSWPSQQTGAFHFQHLARASIS